MTSETAIENEHGYCADHEHDWKKYPYGPGMFYMQCTKCELAMSKAEYLLLERLEKLEAQVYELQSMYRETILLSMKKIEELTGKVENLEDNQQREIEEDFHA